MAGKGVGKSLVWVLMGLLVLGLGGFGVTNLSGTVRSVGSVGDAEIDINEYARALQREIRALEAERGEAMSFAQAQALGVDQTVLSQLVASAALNDETQRMGISIGDANLREQIVSIPNFQGIDGSFDREAYAFSLERAGLSEADFEEGIREETARTLLQGAIVSGVNAPAALTDTLVTYLAERRNITWAVLDRSNLSTGLEVPDDSDLRAYHQSHLPDFTSPEIRRITYAWLTPQMIIDTVEVDDQALRDAYEARTDEFNTPERRLVERLAFADNTAANAALARIEAGESFEALVEERGLNLADVDLVDVSRSDLGGAADAVFTADVGDVVGPHDSPIGPALFRVNAVLAAQQTSFDAALPQLRDELARDRARRVVDAQIDSIDNLLAGGATIEDLASETDMELGTIDWHQGMTDGIGAYEAFRSAAAAATADDYPEVIQLEDAGIFTLRLDQVVEPEIIPLEQVRDAVEDGWRKGATVAALRRQSENIVADLKAGKSFAELGMQTFFAEEITRGGFQPDTPPEFIETVFGMQKGDVDVLDGDGRLFVLRLDDILPPADGSEDVTALRNALQDQAANSVSQDLFQALADDIRARAGIQLDQRALNAVHANFQ